MIRLFLSHTPSVKYNVAEIVYSYNKRRYELGERIASGGNAVVYQCYEQTSGDEFAIKFHLKLGTTRLARFKREIDLLKDINHEQLLRYIDHGEVVAEHEGRKLKIPFVVLSMCDSNLKELVQGKETDIIPAEYIAQFKGLAEALGKLHEKAIHRDIKPENILVKGETWLLSDFGLCRFNDSDIDITKDNRKVGPTYWMSPESINRVIGNHDVISKKSDVFQLCSVFWFVVTKRHPSGILFEDDWTGPKSIFDVIHTALSHNDERRPSDGNALAKMLNDAVISYKDSR